MEPSRRRFFTTVGAGAVGLGLPGARASAAPAGAKTAADADAPLLQVGEDVAVVETTNGRVRGYVLRGIHHFLGIPYGADTSGANRFMPPQKPKPWTDVYPALWWGNSAPQNMDNRYENKHASFRDHWNYDDVSEDCLRINVFTPAHGRREEAAGAVLDPRRRLHERQRHRARRLQRREPRAAPATSSSVSINHRLGPLGYCNLAGVGGERVRGLRQRGHARHRRRARVGARQHRALRRRSRQRHDHGPVGRRGEGLHADRDAVGARASSTRRSC